MRRYLYALALVVASVASASAQTVGRFNWIELTPDTRTIASNGGGTAATLTLLPLTGLVTLNCQDTDGCDITMSETGIQLGFQVQIVNVGANVATFADQTGVLVLASSPFAMTTGQALSLSYANGRWYEIPRIAAGNVSGPGSSTNTAVALWSGTGGTTLLDSKFTFTGPTTTLKTFTLPNASATILTDNAAVTIAQGGTGSTSFADDTTPVSNGSVLQAKTLPSCADSGGNHLNYDQSTNTFSCGTSSSGGTGTVTHTGSLTANLPVIGNGTADVTIGTTQGNTTKFVSYAGSAPANNDCAKFDSNGNLTTVGAGCGTSSGTVTNTGTLTSGSIVVGNGGVDVSTTTTGTGVVTALGVNVGSSGAFVANGGALGTPSSGNGANITGVLATGALLSVQYITTTGAYTYTPTSGTNSIVLEMCGGGGGGAGVTQAGAGNVSPSGSGGGGGYLLKRLTANFSGATGVVGAKGAGGAAGSNSGNTGTATTFVDTAGSPTTYTANGGVGGTTTGAGGGPPYLSSTGGWGAGGTATNGDINVTGGSAMWSWGPATGAVVSGNGGSSRFSGGAAGAVTGTGAGTAGIAATGKCGGGSGAVSSNNGGGNKAGGDGSDGIVIIWEYR